jgi:hypothetical protein
MKTLPSLLAIMTCACASAVEPGFPPQFDRFLFNMTNAPISYLRQVHLNLQDIECRTNSLSACWNFDLAGVYYDAGKVNILTFQFTSDPRWRASADDTTAVYRDTYVFPNDGKAQGYRLFTTGLYFDAVLFGNAASSNAVILLSTNASYALDSTPLADSAGVEVTREVAYNIMAMVDAQKLSGLHRARLENFVTQSLNHLELFQDNDNTRIERTFWLALACQALISYHSNTNDPRILPSVRKALDWLWQAKWSEQSRAFFDSNNLVKDEPAATDPAPDLNLLFAPAFSWVWHQTGDQTYLLRGDKVFEGGVTQAYLGDGKHFNQNYMWSFDYLVWRNFDEIRLNAGATSTARQLSWPNWAVGFVLEGAENLLGPWRMLPMEHVVTNGVARMTLPESEPSTFFRLRKL